MRSEAITRGLFRTIQNILYSLIVCITHCNTKDYKGNRTIQKGGLFGVCVQSLTLCVLIVYGLIGLSLPPKGGRGGCLVQPSSPLLGVKGKRYFERIQPVRIAKQRGFLLVG